MIVLDASVVIEVLTQGTLANSITRHLAASGDAVIVPHLIDVEVADTLRKLVSLHRIDQHRSNESLENLKMLPAERYPHTFLLSRIWELRHNFSAYDAAYIALAEAANATLYTSDQKLCKGHRAAVVLFKEP